MGDQENALEAGILVGCCLEGWMILSGSVKNASRSSSERGTQPKGPLEMRACCPAPWSAMGTGMGGSGFLEVTGGGLDNLCIDAIIQRTNEWDKV